MSWATLRQDLPTSRGTYAAGLPVKVWHLHGKTATICLDPPTGKHAGKCHTYRILITQLNLQEKDHVES